MVRIMSTPLLLLMLVVEIASLINSEDTQPGEFPFMARLSSYRPHSHWCGGSLISSRTVLTAAHCVEWVDPDNIVVTLGDYALNETGDIERRMGVSQIIVHEDFHHGTFNEPFNDIALLILEEVELEESGYSVISLPTDRSIYEEGTTITITGWGDMGDGSRLNTLQKVEQVLPDQGTCLSYWKGVGLELAEESGIPASVVEETIASGWIDGMLCTGTPPLEKQRFWYGDSGGPLFVQDNGTWTLVSLVSWNTPRRTGIEGLYDFDMSVDVLFYVDWIRRNMV
ncbi:chymotrypsinogen A-like isoform X2 [Bolinopsis microptera]|uniref:chymotrypsinogen A-like isoform X2 n=1 Tax=Bolinopsis microptera TaxID=2820187 RepID=UPI00307AC13C